MKTAYMWVTRDGTKIPIEKMEWNHIMKSLFYFRNSSAYKAKERVSALLQEIFRRNLEQL